MDKNIDLYKELLVFTKNIKNKYLKNVPVFENQLSFEGINELCYIKMYKDITDRSLIKTTPQLYKEISGLEELYKKARKFFLTPRNKSIKGLDVQLGKQFEEAFINYLNSNKILAMRADTKNRRLPDIQVLDKTRNIKAYIELKYHNAPFMLSWRLLNREPYEGSITLDTEKVQKQLIEIDAELERPVYYVHWVDFPDLKGIFFNTNEQIEDYLNNNPIEFVRKEREGDFKVSDYKIVAKVGYSEKFYPPLHEMGDFEELIDKLKS